MTTTSTAIPDQKKVGMVSLGCPKALVDSERILTRLRADGYAMSPDYAGADVVLVNTCGFLDSAKEESLQAIGEAIAGRVTVQIVTANPVLRAQQAAALRRAAAAQPFVRSARAVDPAELQATLGQWFGTADGDDPVLRSLPMPALVAVMIMVSIGTFSWNSIPNIGKHPWQSSVVMLTTVAVVVATHNLALGVLAGVILSGVFFTHKVMTMFEVVRERDGETATYRAKGQIFYASVERFEAALGPESIMPDPADHVIIDVSKAHFWDISAVGALDKVVERMRRNGRSVQVVGDFNGWDGGAHAMRPLGGPGVWDLFVPGVGAGARYKFRVEGADGVWHEKIDPLAFGTEVPPATASVVVEPTHRWRDDAWVEQRDATRWAEAPVSIYEVHLGSWRPGLTYRELAEELGDYLLEMGFTHVELLPVAEQHRAHARHVGQRRQPSYAVALAELTGVPDDHQRLGPRRGP